MSKVRNYIKARKYAFILASLITYGTALFLIGTWLSANYEFRSPIVKRPAIISPLANKQSRLHVPVANAEAPVLTSEAVREPNLKTLVLSYFPKDQRDAVDELVMRESSWNPQAVNQSSGAYGLFQILPFEKSGCTRDNIACQTLWFEAYLKDRYGDIFGALEFHDLNNYY